MQILESVNQLLANLDSGLDAKSFEFGLTEHRFETRSILLQNYVVDACAALSMLDQLASSTALTRFKLFEDVDFSQVLVSRAIRDLNICYTSYLRF